MRLFHGTRAAFTAFSIEYPGTGEAGEIRAVWFTEQLSGAQNHSARTKQPGHRRVYECELHPETLVLLADTPLTQQPVVMERLRTVLPVSISVHGFYDELFCDYFNYLGVENTVAGDRFKKQRELDLLRSAGIDAIYDYERGGQDNYQHGATTVVLAPEKIRIVTIHESQSPGVWSVAPS
ncbi:hypothetical protein [Serratia sp. S4]|uniref:hypothetical protein n=1 Tax=Serratia TaxID=613 RepID=UPI00037023E7|nr:hypothetical protein [Serratia sp. S4]